jgi:hypothetical protein
MKRRISFIISAILLSGVLAVALRSVDFSTPKRLISAFLPDHSSAVPAVPSLHPVDSPSRVEPISSQAVSTASPAFDPMRATPLREVRVRAVRDGRDYGWVQLPRGTRVELVRDEGSTLVVRFDQVTLRVSRAVVQAGLLVPVPRAKVRLAGL